MSRQCASFVVAFLALAAPGGAAPLIDSYAQVQGRFDDGDPAHDNLLGSTGRSNVAGSVAELLVCIPAAGDVCTIFPGSVWPYGNGSAAEVFTDFGVNRVRNSTANTGTNSTYSTQAFSRWHDDFTYNAATAGRVTFELTVEASWQNGGRLYFEFGFFDPSLGLTQGFQFSNCLDTELSGGCPDPATWAGVYLVGSDPQNNDGTFSVTVRLSAIWNPLEQRTVSSFLEARSVGGASVDAFNTARLTAIVLEPGASISSASGTAYQVRVVPEPALVSLLGAALGAATLVMRFRR